MGLIEIRDNLETSSLYGVIVSVKERKTDKVFTSRVFTFEKDNLKAYFRIWCFIQKLLNEGSISRETHYIEVKPTKKHRKPELLFKMLKNQVRVIENNGFDF